MTNTWVQYKKQIEYNNQTATDIMTNEIALMLPTFSKHDRQKRGIITSLITGFIGLAYEGISIFLHYRRQKTLQKAVKVIKDKVDIQHNMIFHLEESTVMYGVYNSDTLEDLIKTVHKLCNTTTIHRIVHNDSMQIYEEPPVPGRPRQSLANWTSVRLGNDPNRHTVDEITIGPQHYNLIIDSTDHQIEKSMMTRIMIQN